MTEASPASTRPSLLLVDDNVAFCSVLAPALERHGYAVRAVHDGSSGIRMIDATRPDFAVFDLGLPDMSGLHLVKQMGLSCGPNRCLVLTGEGSIATAIDAIKLGATTYLTKPANADDIIIGLHQKEPALPASQALKRKSVERVEWEYIQQVIRDCTGNLSQAARSLRMHRRTLQRKLQKNPPRD